MTGKILTVAELPDWSRHLRTQQRRIVATNGCFDLLHVGHVRYLRAARALGDALVVGINADASVRALKGASRPLNAEADRAEIIAALESVDAVAIFPDVRATEFLKASHPTIYAKGGDYTPETLDPEERATLEKIGAEIRIISFEPGYSTSGMLARMHCE